MPQSSPFLLRTSPHQSWVRIWCWFPGLCQRVKFPLVQFAMSTRWTSVTGYDVDADDCDEQQTRFFCILSWRLDPFKKQEPARETSAELSYMLQNVVPSHTYRARIRTRLSISCHERPLWSEWSKWSNDAGWCHLFVWHLTFPQCRVFDVCLRSWIRGTAGFPPQLAGDRPNFAGTTHDPPGCSAFGAIAEVESPLIDATKNLWFTQVFPLPANLQPASL